ncbi:uncharacterized protein CANTADRAFT_26874 [Suhomyces tanzawaensis NRRL Y-17324]|uniref:MutL C-terminal dimerisation domain-containing protein n=1 Tax=Suhomyces tanzawaensis NRRL Y-17324 TaxID=984487 RepID=A0A1E4SEA4_9ASCO|nr:uncharacterized protein CANTADRAFT_26874 [Suhomyces tanzawaensis NRRL Y-17324]ODV77851.1 hypothetical protein CANTADRAFT_26874 [Suhomyces tanzawaensis NRRL Y-17324]
MAPQIVKLDDALQELLQSQVTIRTYEDAIRELVENSADAGASEIIIKLDFQSLSVLVKDTGTGIAPSDLASVGSRYHTSKFHERDQIITTFGFRGEALHSLRAISNLTIVSKQKGLKPYKSWDGSVEPFEELELANFFQIGDLGESGTSVTVTNLFSSVPVRRKQQMQVPEYRTIESIKQSLLRVLCRYSGIRMEVYKTNYTLNALDCIILIDLGIKSSEKYSSIIRNLFGKSVLPSFESINYTFDPFKLSGVIGKSCISSKSHQYIFINGRGVILPSNQLKAINRWLTQTMLDANDSSPTKSKRHFYKYPIFLLNFITETKLEDLIHDDIRGFYYKNSDVIFKMVERVFERFLSSQGYQVERLSTSMLLSPDPRAKRTRSNPTSPTRRTNPKISSPSRQGSPTKNTVSNLKYFQASPSMNLKCNLLNLAPPMPNFESSNLVSPNHSCEDEDDTLYPEIPVGFQLSRKDLLQGYHIVGQVDRKFILIKIDNPTYKEGSSHSPILAILDQHACDERVRIEGLLKDFILQALDPSINILLKLVDSIQIRVLETEQELFTRFEKNLNSYGIRYRIVGNMVIITHLPHIIIQKTMDNEFLKFCLIQHLYDLDNQIKQEDINVSKDEWFRMVQHLPRIIVTLFNSKACRSSIMFGDELSKSDMNNMIQMLQQCHLPFQCAHGRPSITPLTNLEGHGSNSNPSI